MLVVRPMRGAAPGFVTAWTSLTDRGEALWAIAIGDDGAPGASRSSSRRTGDDIVWVDVVPTDAGAVCPWAEEVRGGEANVIAAALDTDGKVRGAPARIANGVMAWHALEVPGGVGLSSVVRGPKAGAGVLSYAKLDLEGRATTAPVAIATKPTVSGDVEVVRQGDKLVFAWTDRTSAEPLVAAAALDDHGAVLAPRTDRLRARRRGADRDRLGRRRCRRPLRISAPTHRCVRRRRRRRGRNRRMYIARISPELTLASGRATFESAGRAAPEIAATATGFAVLAPVRDCEAELRTASTPASFRRCSGPTKSSRSSSASCSLSAAIRRRWRGASPVADDTCLALAASGTSPARVRTAAVSPGSTSRTRRAVARAARAEATASPRATDRASST